MKPLQVFKKLKEEHSDAHCELNHDGPFQLLIATILSARTTDVAVNKATPGLFEKWPTPMYLAEAKLEEVEQTIKTISFFQNKSKNIVNLSKILVADFKGEVPNTMADLVKLPGVGRKTANIILGVAFETPEGIVVDTHVQRVAQRLGWTKEKNPLKIEKDLMAHFPDEDWNRLGLVLVFHGRRICKAKKPLCTECPINDECPTKEEINDTSSSS